MLNVFARRTAPWVCAWMLGWPAAHAAEDARPEREAPALFEQYQGWRDAPSIDWRAANERVGEIGGWRAYLRESRQGSDGTEGAGPGNPAHHEH